MDISLFSIVLFHMPPSSSSTSPIKKKVSSTDHPKKPLNAGEKRRLLNKKRAQKKRWKNQKSFPRRKKRERCKTEKKLLLWFEENYPKIKVTYQPKYQWCKSQTTRRYYPFDLAIEAWKLIIELDGRQHYFKARRSWNPNRVQERDLLKMKYALKKGYTVVRVLQESVWYDRHDWEVLFRKHLRLHRDPRAILLDTDKAEFDSLREKMQRDNVHGTNT
jgi:very-short-patch-repair endonuclease